MLRALLLLALSLPALASVASAQVTQGCYGDGTGRVCKCDNNDALNPTTGGCLNSAGTGAVLSTNGNIGIAENDLQFSLTGGVPNALAGLLSGDNILGGGIGILGLPESDGLRCVGVNLSRHGARALNSFGDTSADWGAPLTGPPAGIIGQAGFVSGQTRHFQVRYRDDPNASPCGFGTNTSQSISITFIPMTPVEPCDAAAQMACIAAGNLPCTTGVNSADCGPIDPCTAAVQMSCISMNLEPCTIGVGSADCGAFVDPCTQQMIDDCLAMGLQGCVFGTGIADCGGPVGDLCTSTIIDACFAAGLTACMPGSFDCGPPCTCGVDEALACLATGANACVFGGNCQCQ